MTRKILIEDQHQFAMFCSDTSLFPEHRTLFKAIVRLRREIPHHDRTLCIGPIGRNLNFAVSGCSYRRQMKHCQTASSKLFIASWATPNSSAPTVYFPACNRSLTTISITPSWSQTLFQGPKRIIKATGQLLLSPRGNFVSTWYLFLTVIRTMIRFFGPLPSPSLQTFYRIDRKEENSAPRAFCPYWILGLAEE